MNAKIAEVAKYGAWFVLYSSMYFVAMVASAGLGALKGTVRRA